jgi:hypothetical protein
MRQTIAELVSVTEAFAAGGNPQVSAPDYDRSQITAGIAHIGVGIFPLQALQSSPFVAWKLTDSAAFVESYTTPRRRRHPCRHRSGPEDRLK